MPQKKTPKRLKASIKKDRVSPKDWGLPWAVSCEKCSHFSGRAEPVAASCTLGFPVEPHREANQQKSFELSGTVAFCRFFEMD